MKYIVKINAVQAGRPVVLVTDVEARDTEEAHRLAEEQAQVFPNLVIITSEIRKVK